MIFVALSMALNMKFLDIWPKLPLWLQDLSARVAWNPGIFVSAAPAPFRRLLSAFKRLRKSAEMPSAEPKHDQKQPSEAPTAYVQSLLPKPMGLRRRLKALLLLLSGGLCSIKAVADLFMAQPLIKA